MRFKDIAARNFRVNAGKYISFFLCNSLSIMIFFMYSTLLYNSALKQKNYYDMTEFVFVLGIISVSLFSLFFINYAHTSFIKSRNKEFGLYMAIGMSARDIRKIILLENALIMLASLLAGLLSGLVFSRIFQMVVLKLLDIADMGFSLGYECFILTGAVFSAIFLCTMLRSGIETRKLDISELLRNAPGSGAASGNGLLVTFAGLAVILLSFVLLNIITGSEPAEASLPQVGAYLVVSLLGVYLTISGMGKSLLHLLKRKRRLYYKHILTAAETGMKYDRQKRLLFILSLLSSMIIFLVASPFSLRSLSKSIAELSQPHHLEYVELGNINRLPAKALDGVLKSAGSPVSRARTVEFLSLYIRTGTDKYDLLHSKPVISQSEYNKAFGAGISLKRGQAVNIITAWEPGYHGIEPSAAIQLQAGSNTYEFKIADSRHGTWVSGSSAYPGSSGIILNDDDYGSLKEAALSGEKGIYHLFDFVDWERSGTAAALLHKELETSNTGLSPDERRVGSYLKGTSLIEAYEGLKRGYTMFSFVTVVAGILFFIAAGSVIYFRLYSAVEPTGEKFFRLYKLGFTEDEIAGIFKGELRIIFFIPLVFGSLLGFSFIWFMTNWVGGRGVLAEFMLYAAVAAAVYFSAQMIFYKVSKSRFLSKIFESLETRIL